MTSVCLPTLSGKVKLKPLPPNYAVEVRFGLLDDLGKYSDGGIPVYFDVAYLRSVSLNDSEAIKHVFPCVYLNGDLVAFGSFCLLKLDKTNVIQAIADQSSSGRLWKQTIKSVLPFILGSCESHLQILIAGNMLVSGPYGLYFTKDCPPEMQNLVWQAALSHVEEHLGKCDLTVIKDFNASEASKALPLTNDFLKVNTLPLMILPLTSNWTSFADYLEAMSTKYRTRARAALHKAGSLTTEYWEAAEIRTHRKEIQLLYNEVYKRAKFRIQPVNEAYIPTLAEAFPDGRFRFIAWKDGDKLIGFSTAFLNGDRMDAHLIGMDYAYNRSHSLYLNMIYRYIQDALEVGANLVDFGRTAMEIKSTAGAIPQELDVFIRLKSVMGNKLAKRLSTKIKSENWIQRHPFKVSF